jgi:lambda family phage portal protein
VPQLPFIERAIEAVSPAWAAKRAFSRVQLESARTIQNLYGADTPNRLDSYWPPSRAYHGGNDPLNRWRLTRLRDRGRQLVMNNPLAVGMLDRAVENVIGHGMRLQVTTPDDKFNATVEPMWRDWLDNADIRGVFSASGFQQVLYRHHLLDGDVGCGLVSRGDRCYLQGYEGDLIDTLGGGWKPEEGIVDGIKFNDDNRALGYYIVPFNRLGAQSEESYIPAKNFVFYPRMKRLGQVRGEPVFSQEYQLFDQIDGFKEAVIVAARIAACQGLIVTGGTAPKTLGNLPAQQTGERFEKIDNMQPGMVRYLPAGMDVKGVNPTQPTQNFPDFMAALLRFAGLTLGLPLELVLLDFSRTNYSSARASLLQAYRSFRTQQQFFCECVMSRIYRWRLCKWVKNGQLLVPNSLLADPGNGTRPQWWKHQWIAPGWAWVDPVKEIQAAQMAIDSGLETVTGVLQQHGKELTDITAVRARETALFKKLNIVLSKSNMTRDAIITPGAPGQPGTPDGQDPEDPETADEPGTDPEED